jgi:hypothetical protein
LRSNTQIGESVAKIRQSYTVWVETTLPDNVPQIKQERDYDDLEYYESCAYDHLEQVFSEDFLRQQGRLTIYDYELNDYGEVFWDEVEE